jgi:hypothetical protein
MKLLSSSCPHPLGQVCLAIMSRYVEKTKAISRGHYATSLLSETVGLTGFTYYLTTTYFLKSSNQTPLTCSLLDNVDSTRNRRYWRCTPGCVVSTGWAAPFRVHRTSVTLLVLSLTQSARNTICGPGVRLVSGGQICRQVACKGR